MCTISQLQDGPHTVTITYTEGLATSNNVDKILKSRSKLTAS